MTNANIKIGFKVKGESNFEKKEKNVITFNLEIFPYKKK